MPSAVTTETQRIAEMLVEGGLITQDDLDAALEIQDRTQDRLISILISQGALESQALVNFLAEPRPTQPVELASFDIDPAVIALVPQNFALLHKVLPLDRRGGTLTVAVLHPMEPHDREALEEHTGLRIKPLICSTEDVEASILRHYVSGESLSSTAASLNGPIKLTTAVTLLSHLDALPALPDSVQRVKQMIDDDAGSGAEIGEVISQDPAIAAKVLKVANSAAYGFSHQVDNVGLAVSLLGLLETYAVVISTAVVSAFDSRGSFNYNVFWQESLLCATVTNAMSKAFGARSTGIFSAGLLHDIGRAGLAQVVPRHYENVDDTLTGRALIRAEEELMGINHAEAGYQLAAHWNLPPVLAECIRYHHAPELAASPYQKAAALVNVADVVVRLARSGTDPADVDFAECRTGLEIIDATEKEVLQVFDSVPKPTAEDLW